MFSKNNNAGAIPNLISCQTIGGKSDNDTEPGRDTHWATIESTDMNPCGWYYLHLLKLWYKNIQ